jgi:hypothetical protein
MFNFLKSRWGEFTSVLSVSGAGAVAVGYLAGQLTARQAAMGIAAALIGYFLPEKSVSAGLKCLAVLLLCGVALTACKLTGNPSADADAFIAQVGTFKTDFNSKLVSLGTGSLTVGKAACGYASEIHGLYRSPLLQLVGGAAAAAAGSPEAIAAADVIEGRVFAGAETGCAIVDAADPANPSSALLPAVQQVIAALPQLEAALGVKNPIAAAKVVAPAS